MDEILGFLQNLLLSLPKRIAKFPKIKVYLLSKPFSDFEISAAFILNLSNFPLVKL